MGKINIIDGGQATDEEVALFLNGKRADETTGKSAKDIQPIVRRPGQASIKDILPPELQEGPVAKPTEVVDQAMARSEQNMDMIGECAKILRAYGADERQITAMFNDPLIREARHRSTFAQRSALNVFWSQSLGVMGESSMRYRRNLVSQGTVRDWLNLFGNGTAQFIAQFSLPLGCGAPIKQSAQNLRNKM